MRRYWIAFAVASFVALAGAANVNASVSSSFIAGLGPHVDNHVDESFEHLAVDGGTANIVDVGDVFEGIALFQSVGVLGGSIAGGTRLSTNGGTGFELTAVFRAEVATKVANLDGTFDFTFVPDAAFEAAYGAGAMIALFESAVNFNPSAATVAAAIATADDGALQAVMGFAGLAGEGWAASATTDDTTALPGGVSLPDNNFQASLNLILGGPAGDGDYPADFDIDFTRVSAFAPGAFTQFSVNGQFFGNEGPSAANFPVGDSTDIFFSVAQQVIPEPASFLAWVGLLSMAGVCAARRQRNA